MSVPYLRLSGFYFFYFATLGAFIPYWGLHLKNAGFNPQQIGELSALLSATRIIAPNLSGWLADRTGKSLSIIRFCCFFSAIFFCGFIFQLNYAGLTAITVGFGLFWNAALPQFEAVTLYHLKAQTHRYSQIRLWGSVGFIAAVLGMGRFLDLQPITYLPVIVAILLAANWLIAMFVPEAGFEKSDRNRRGIGQIIGKPEVLAFLLVNLLLQIAHAPYYVFYSLYLKQHQYSATLTGGLWALGVAAEIVLFIYMARLLKQFSLRGILLCSIALGIIRWLLIADCVDNLASLVFAQLLHAATFGGVHVTAIHLVHRYFGNQHQGQGQALLGSISYGLGGMLGSLYSGQLWQTEGGGLIYTLSAFCCGLALLIAFIWVGRENSQKSKRLG
jgi:PPP family 3-phenylpropionic acid transporter